MIARAASARRANPAGAVTVAGTVAFLAVVLRTLWRQHVALGDHVFDVGIFDQGLWLLSTGREPFVSLRGLHLFADHSSYVMVLLAPLYWLWSDYRMLMIVSVVCLASGAPLLHAIARRHGLAPWVATGLAAAFLLHPVVLWQAWEDFHPEIVAVPCILGAYLLARSERPWSAVVPVVVLLLAKEDAAFVVVPLGVLLAVEGRNRRLGLVVAGLGAAAFALNVLVLLPHFSPTGELIYTGRYAAFGDSIGAIAGEVVRNPGSVLEALATRQNVVYLASTIGPLFLAVRAPRVLAVGVPITVVNLLSSFPYQHEARRHYTIYLITVVALAAVVGAARLSRTASLRHSRELAVAGMVAAALMGHALVGPGPLWGSDWDGKVPHSRIGDVERALAVIPSDATVAADTYVATRLAHRPAVYRLPVPWVRKDWGVDDVPPLPSPSTVEWVAVLKSVTETDPDLASTLLRIRATGEFVVRHDDELILVLERR